MDKRLLKIAEGLELEIWRVMSLLEFALRCMKQPLIYRQYRLVCSEIAGQKVNLKEREREREILKITI